LEKAREEERRRCMEEAARRNATQQTYAALPDVVACHHTLKARSVSLSHTLHSAAAFQMCCAPLQRNVRRVSHRRRARRWRACNASSRRVSLTPSARHARFASGPHATRRRCHRVVVWCGVVLLLCGVCTRARARAFGRARACGCADVHDCRQLGRKPPSPIRSRSSGKTPRRRHAQTHSHARARTRTRTHTHMPVHERTHAPRLSHAVDALDRTCF
jgi:hypothetical protein